jgi:integrase
MIAKQLNAATNTTSLPSYRLRKGYSQAIVTLTDAVTGKRKDYWLGEYGSPESREMYHRVLSQWESLNRRLPSPPPPPEVAAALAANGDVWNLRPVPAPALFRGITIGEVIRDYRGHVDGTFKPATRASIFMVMNLLDQVFGNTAAEQFGPAKLRLLREQMIKGSGPRGPRGRGDAGGGGGGRKAWSRTTVNKAVHQVCAMFRWAASHEMLPVGIHTHLKTVPALRRGQSDAADYEPIRPVAPEVVEKTKPYLSRQIKALVELQLLTGARGGELLKLRPMDMRIDDDGKVWTIQPLDHKTAHHGHERTLFLGPKAQQVLAPFLENRPSEEYLFSPAQAERERRDAATAKRKTRPGQGHGRGTNRSDDPKRKPGDFYTAAAYRNAIQCACEKANIPRWHPHQLRHTAGTLIRREFGLEAARIILGHSSASVTDAVYAQRDMERIAQVMGAIG